MKFNDINIFKVAKIVYVLYTISLLYCNICHAMTYHTILTSPKIQQFINTNHQKSIQYPTKNFIDSIAIIIDQDVITHQELAHRFYITKKNLIKQNMQIPTDTQLKHQVIENMVNENIQAQVIHKNINLSHENTLNHILTTIAKQHELSLNQFHKQLEQKGINFLLFKENIRNKMIMQKIYTQEIEKKSFVSESEINDFLITKNSKTLLRETLHLAHILIRITKNNTPHSTSTNYQHAKEILHKLRSGFDFNQIATIYSNSNDALNGGDLGWRNEDRIPKLFLDAVRSLRPGEISNIIKSDQGFHIIKLINRHTMNLITKIPQIEQVHVRHILLPTNPLIPAKKTREQLLKLKTQLENKVTSFEKLTKLYSKNSYMLKIEDLGWLSSYEVAPQFINAITKLSPNKISQPIESPFGFHLIEILERRSVNASEKWIRQKAKQTIHKRKIQQTTIDWLKKLRNYAYIEYRI